MKRVRRGTVNLESFVENDIAIQCDTQEEEALLMTYLSELGVKEKNGGELWSCTYSFGVEIASYWYLLAEDGFYKIAKTRLGRYYLQYCTNHSGKVINIGDCIEEDKPVTDNKSEFDFGALSFLLGTIILIFVMIKFC